MRPEAEIGVMLLEKEEDFPFSLVVKTAQSHCRECGFNPRSGN